MGMEIFFLLKDLNAKGVTMIIVTPEERIGTVGIRRIRLKDGRIVERETIKERFDTRSPPEPS